MALFGPNAFRIAEKLTNRDLSDPDKQAPFLLQGPFCHISCQIVTLEKSADGSGGFLLTCSRGYGESMVHAILEAGAEFGLRPTGENLFTHWIQELWVLDPKINGIIGLNATAGAVLGVCLWHALLRPCVLMQSAALQGEKDLAL